ncbi:hypothetical protein D3C72_2058270 [compost metagenome]
MARAAKAAYALSEVSDKATKIPVKVRNCGNSAAPWSMNCGNSAVKNMVAFGLVTAVRKADLNSFSGVGRTLAERSAAPCSSIGLFFSSWRAPR